MYSFRSFFNLRIVKYIGAGSYGRVFEAFDTLTGLRVAVKFIRKEDVKNMGYLAAEYTIQSILHHRNICQLYRAVDTSRSLVLVMELVEGMDLHTYLRSRGRIEEAHARRLFAQILDGISYLHLHSIVHRDLKLENILVDRDGRVKICDFGLSSFYDRESALEDFCGTPLCAPPEITRGIPYMGPEVDVWCLGVLLYSMVHGKLPFGHYECGDRGTLDQDLPLDESLSHELRDLIRRLIEPNKSARIKMKHILRHAWIRGEVAPAVKSAFFVDLEVVRKMVGMGFDRERIARKLSDRGSKEHGAYALIKQKASLGYNIASLCTAISHDACAFIDLGFLVNPEHLRRHHEKLAELKLIEEVRRAGMFGCLYFLFWGSEGRFKLEKRINSRVEDAVELVGKLLSRLPCSFVQKERRFSVGCRDGRTEMRIELRWEKSWTACVFLLARGDKHEFARAIFNLIKMSDE
jgi:serine/threonine protein kinase